jgi:hypothetical protein
MAEETLKKTYYSAMTKKRYAEIKDCLAQKYSTEDLDNVMKDICRIMNFDPDKSSYTKELGQKIIARRKEVSEKTGISLYILNGGKTHYEKTKHNKTT